MVSEEERGAAELSRIKAETRKLAAEADKLEAEADKLEAEEQRLLRSIVRDAWTTALALFAAGLAALQFAQQSGLAVGVTSVAAT